MPEADGPDAVASAANLRDRCSAFGIELVLAGLRRIEHVGGVRKHDDLDAHAVRQTFQLAHIGGLDPSGKQVDLLLVFAGALGEVRHQRLRHVGETGDVRTHVAGRVRVNDVLAFGNLSFRLWLC